MYISFSKFAKVIPSISRETLAKQQLRNFMSRKPWPTGEGRKDYPRRDYPIKNRYLIAVEHARDGGRAAGLLRGCSRCNR